MKTILIIEDEKRLRELVVLYLKNEGWKVLQANNGEDGINLFQENNIDLIILDIMLPKKDGWTVCRNIRQKNTSIPIVMLTARKTEDDELFGFELGADEYITKPFNPNILIARIKSALNKNPKSQQNKSAYVFSDLVVDPEKHQIILQNKEIELSPKEYDLLLYLIKNIELALSRNQILDAVWGTSYYTEDRVVDTTIKRLRKKLNNRFIKTVRSVGYKFKAEA